MGLTLVHTLRSAACGHAFLAARCCAQAARATCDGGLDVVGIGVDFTSCTMIPCRLDGSPICLEPPYEQALHAWPKLWKHHGATAQADSCGR